MRPTSRSARRPRRAPQTTRNTRAGGAPSVPPANHSNGACSGPEASPILRLRGTTPRMAYSQTAETAAIGLIDQHTLERLLSPELMLVDAELAERARALLREPHETNGRGTYMSALGTHEFTAGTSLGLEPPLSPPVVRRPEGLCAAGRRRRPLRAADASSGDPAARGRSGSRRLRRPRRSRPRCPSSPSPRRRRLPRPLRLPSPSRSSRRSRQWRPRRPSSRLLP